MFAEHKIEIKPAIMYRTMINEWPKEEAFDYDMVVLFTPSGVSALKTNFPNLTSENIKIACIGTNTANALKEIGLEADIVPTPEYPSITAAIKAYLEQHCV
jgi:uroporphyrinogen-III synthase